MPYADREMKRAYQATWYAARRMRYLKGKHCEICGSTENLEFHHRDRRTKLSHRVFSWKKERLEAELAKCAIWCHACHHGFESNLMRKPFEHGLRGYRMKCRCEICRQAKRESRIRPDLSERSTP
jgi:hypothetical protein